MRMSILYHLKHFTYLYYPGVKLGISKLTAPRITELKGFDDSMICKDFGVLVIAS